MGIVRVGVITLAFLTVACGDDKQSSSPTAPSAVVQLSKVRIEVERAAPDPGFPGTCKSTAIRIKISGPDNLIHSLLEPHLAAGDSLSGGTAIVREHTCGWKFEVGWHNAQPLYAGSNTTVFTAVAVSNRVDFSLEGKSAKQVLFRIGLRSSQVEVLPQTLRITGDRITGSLP